MSKKQPKQKMGRRRDRHFYKKDTQMARRHMKRCSTLLIIGEMQIKSTLRYHLSALSMAFIKMSANSKGWKGWQEEGILLHCWWEYKLVLVLRRTLWRFLKKKQTLRCHIIQQSHAWAYPEKTVIWKGTCTPMLIAAWFTIAKTRKQSKYSLIDKWIKQMWYI